MFGIKGLLYAACASLLVSTSLAAFDINSKENVVVYYASQGKATFGSAC